jgi:hypothetical protein
VLPNASRRCRIANREIGVPGGRTAAKRAGKSACATGADWEVGRIGRYAVSRRGEPRTGAQAGRNACATKDIRMGLRQFEAAELGDPCFLAPGSDWCALVTNRAKRTGN